MNTGDAIIAAVCERPDDDTPRLGYADYLEDVAGDTPDPDATRARAEFIRVQVELARLEPTLIAAGSIVALGPDNRAVMYDPASPTANTPVGVMMHPTPNPKWAALKKRADEILGDGPPEYRFWKWAEPIVTLLDARTISVRGGIPRPAAWGFDRGFVENLTCESAGWLAHADAITAAHPVRRVRLTTQPEVEFGPIDARAVDRVDGVYLQAHWDATAGGVTMRLGGALLVDRRAIEMGGVDGAHRMRERHDEHVRFARTPLGYMKCRWPKIEFTLPDPYEGFEMRRLSRRSFRETIAGPPILMPPTAFIRPGGF